MTRDGGDSACHTEAHAKIADDCVAAGWGLRGDPANPFHFQNFISFELVCHIPTATPDVTGSTAQSYCIIKDFNDFRGAALCTDVYGDPPKFPTKPADFDNRPFAGNCANSNNGAIPGGYPVINRNGEQECACNPDSHAGAYPNCVEAPVAIRDEVNKCVRMGWTVSVDNGGSCRIPLHSAAMTMDYAECHFDDDAPKCADVFGAVFAIPKKPVSGSPRYVFNCDPDGTKGLEPATVNLNEATACDCDPTNPNNSAQNYALDYAYERDGLCVSRETVGAASNPALALSQAEICRALFGKVGADTICSEVDANDTFCILDSKEGFPCRGLFKHILTCNADFDRPALNPFFCGKKCGAGKRALGRHCLRADFGAGWAEARGWCAAAAAARPEVRIEVLLQPATGDGVFWCGGLSPNAVGATQCRVGMFENADEEVLGRFSANIVNKNIVECAAGFYVCEAPLRDHDRNPLTPCE